MNMQQTRNILLALCVKVQGWLVSLPSVKQLDLNIINFFLTSTLCTRGFVGQKTQRNPTHIFSDLCPEASERYPTFWDAGKQGYGEHISNMDSKEAIWDQTGNRIRFGSCCRQQSAQQRATKQKLWKASTGSKMRTKDLTQRMFRGVRKSWETFKRWIREKAAN